MVAITHRMRPSEVEVNDRLPGFLEAVRAAQGFDVYDVHRQPATAGLPRGQHHG